MSKDHVYPGTNSWQEFAGPSTNSTSTSHHGGDGRYIQQTFSTTTTFEKDPAQSDRSMNSQHKYHAAVSHCGQDTLLRYSSIFCYSINLSLLKSAHHIRRLLLISAFWMASPSPHSCDRSRSTPRTIMYPKTPAINHRWPKLKPYHLIPKTTPMLWGLMARRWPRSVGKLFQRQSLFHLTVHQRWIPQYRVLLVVLKPRHQGVYTSPAVPV